MTAAHGVNVTPALLTGMRAGSKVASEVDSPAQTGLRRDCGTPYPTPEHLFDGDRGGDELGVFVPLNLNGRP